MGKKRKERNQHRHTITVSYTGVYNHRYGNDRVYYALENLKRAIEGADCTVTEVYTSNYDPASGSCNGNYIHISDDPHSYVYHNIVFDGIDP
jgi:hypothetical protein